jgi:hypothetical protein
MRIITSALTFLLLPAFLFAQSTKELLPKGGGDACEMKSMGLYSGSCNNYLYVDEDNHDGDLSFVGSNGSLDMDLYKIEAFQLPEGLSSEYLAIDSVVISTRARSGNGWSSGFSFRAIIKTGGQIYTSGDMFAGSNWKNFSFTWELNPATGEPWSLDDISGLQIGQENGAQTASSSAEQFRFTRTSALVYYHILSSSAGKSSFSDKIKIFYSSEAKELSVETFFTNFNDFRIELYTLTGNTIKSFDINDATQHNYRFSLFLNPGIYVVTVSNKITSFTQKIIVR